MAATTATRGVWVLVADEAIAKILVRPEDGGDLVEVDALADPDAPLRGAEMRRDAHGRRGSPGIQAATVESAGADERQREAARFAARVAQRLSELHRERRFTRLRIAAAPRFLGLLRPQLGREVAATIEDEQAKELNHLDASALTARLFPPAGASS